MTEKCKVYEFEELADDSANWIQETLRSVSAKVPGEVSPSHFTGRRDITREVMAKSLSSVLNLVNRQTKYIAYLERQAQQLKFDMIINQKIVIELQDELIDAKNKQLIVLKSSVEDTVKTELKSYSDAVQKMGNSATPGVVLDQKILKNVVKDVVAEEDRSRNLMIFGLAEDPDEQISETVSQVLQELGEKPKIEANRIGLKSSKAEKQPARPVKVSVSSSTIVQQILSKARGLRNSDHFKHVFISPDRSAEQRLQQRELVKELKQKKADEPNRRHYIKGGLLCSADKTV